jgi:hypothetical protein
MATATAKPKTKAAAKTKTPTTAATTGTTKATAWRYQVVCNGSSLTELPVNQATMLAQIKSMTTTMSNAKNGKARIIIDCTMPTGKTAPMH